jgi:hypothetical protein
MQIEKISSGYITNNYVMALIEKAVNYIFSILAGRCLGRAGIPKGIRKAIVRL